MTSQISKPIKDSCQCTESNKIDGDFGQISKEQTLCRSYSPLLHVVKIGLQQHTVEAVFIKPTISEGLYNAP